ncbi:MAG: hypothetical protein EOO77_04400 [Oxalobacteraceae bacterium]|nr:MAG: hypothetical protein EOO77_04400 [Oxalobacteraceae bacterium]
MIWESIRRVRESTSPRWWWVIRAHLAHPAGLDAGAEVEKLARTIQKIVNDANELARLDQR